MFETGSWHKTGYVNESVNIFARNLVLICRNYETFLIRGTVHIECKVFYEKSNIFRVAISSELMTVF